VALAMGPTDEEEEEQWLPWQSDLDSFIHIEDIV